MSIAIGIYGQNGHQVHQQLVQHPHARLVATAAFDPARLPDAGQSWGAYYEADPVVVAGSITETLSPLSRFAAGEPTPRGARTRLHYSGSKPV